MPFRMGGKMKNPELMLLLMQFVCTFNIQFYHLFGKLEGFRIIGEKNKGTKKIVSQEKRKIFIEIKTQWQAFKNIVNSMLEVEPEFLLRKFSEESESCHQLKALDKILHEAAHVEVDPDRLSMWEKRYSVLWEGKPQLRLV